MRWLAAESSCDSVVRSTPARSANSTLLSPERRIASARRSRNTADGLMRSAIVRSVHASEVRQSTSVRMRRLVQATGNEDDADSEIAAGRVADARRRRRDRRRVRRRAGVARAASARARDRARWRSSALGTTRCSTRWSTATRRRGRGSTPRWRWRRSASSCRSPPIGRATSPTTAPPSSPIPTSTRRASTCRRRRGRRAARSPGGAAWRCRPSPGGCCSARPSRRCGGGAS